ncbi:MAG: DUF4159 domain-containing protein [Bacteroidota bacterium]|nr:DUF4159 domain-containing protein [Bacteroidota bacterium]
MNKLKISITIAFTILLSFNLFSQNSSVKIGRLVYKGGGDWYANPTSLPNLIKFCNENLNTNINDAEDIEVGSKDIFNYPFIHMTGHGNVVFNFSEAENLRKYLISGGFLHIDDNYGMDSYIRPEIKKVFPESELVELPFSHSIYHQKYDFPKGLPKIHQHDKNSPQGFGIFYQGRLVIYYTYECDLGDGWEDKSVHHDPDATRLKALKMGANIIQFVFMGEKE